MARNITDDVGNLSSRDLSVLQIRPAHQEVSRLDIARLCLDGDTQIRCALDEHRIREYAALMRSGIDFPPIIVWYDGTHFWLSDGFHRVAAAGQAGMRDLCAEIRHGSLHDAQWDSYTANSKHGLRPNNVDFRRTVIRALEHPYSAQLSTNQLAKHLGVPEATLRRWRAQSSSSVDEVRMAQRQGRSYSMKIGNIGCSAKPHRDGRKSKRVLEEEVLAMKENASPELRRILNVVGNWLFRGVTPVDCVKLLEGIVGKPANGMR